PCRQRNWIVQMDHLRGSPALQIFGDLGHVRENEPKLGMTQAPPHEVLLHSIESTKPVRLTRRFRTIDVVRAEKYAREICWSGSSSTEREEIFIQVHQKNVARRKFAAVLL